MNNCIVIEYYFDGFIELSKNEVVQFEIVDGKFELFCDGENFATLNEKTFDAHCKLIA